MCKVYTHTIDKINIEVHYDLTLIRLSLLKPCYFSYKYLEINPLFLNGLKTKILYITIHRLKKPANNHC